VIEFDLRLSSVINPRGEIAESMIPKDYTDSRRFCGLELAVFLLGFR